MVKKQDLLKKLMEIDKYGLTSETNNVISVEDVSTFSEKYIKQETKSVLGLDIYKYSDYDDSRQPLIPFVFDLLLDNAAQYVSCTELSLFKDVNIRENFISTGDGGFIIFPTPLHALIFNLYFFAVLHIFNSGSFSPKFSEYIGEFTVRSTITYDNVFNYENNWYGKAIIKNARILSKDRLNRFIIDKETYLYFMKKFNGLESLSIIDSGIIKQAFNIEGELQSRLFNSELKNQLRNIHVQKVEDTLAKSTKLNIYNIEIQFHTTSMRDDENVSYIFTLGNTNITNI